MTATLPDDPQPISDDDPFVLYESHPLHKAAKDVAIHKKAKAVEKERLDGKQPEFRAVENEPIHKRIRAIGAQASESDWDSFQPDPKPDTHHFSNGIGWFMIFVIVAMGFALICQVWEVW